jgi:acetolactate synthase I/II/III large subunit
LYPENPEGEQPRARLAGDPRQLAKAVALLRRARRPLLLVGGGVTLSGAESALRELADSAQLPVVSTLMGLGAFPGSHPLFFGLLGMHGRTYANRALTECDLLLAVGTRLGDRTTGKASAFGQQATVVHVDVDPAELGKNVRVDVPVVGDVRAVLTALLAAGVTSEHADWLKTLAAWRAATPAGAPPQGERLQPPALIEALYRHSQGQAVVVTDVGQHQMWAAQHYVYERPRSYITSGGLGTMGFGLPAALGAQLGRPQDEVWCVCGDGGVQMNIQEFATLVQEGAAVKVAVLNNGYLGMVRQWQELFYERRYSSSTIQGPDFVGVARAYGMPARRISRWHEVPAALQWASETTGPALVEFLVEPEANVYPMVPPGGTLAEVMEG